MSDTTPTITSIIAGETGIPEKSVAATIRLLQEGATIPFISRYRKEVTGSLDETAIFAIDTRAQELAELSDRKKYILNTIEAQGNLTPELEKRIVECFDPNLLEDIYLPFKPRRRTRAQIARENGLEPLARIIMAQSSDFPAKSAARFLSDNVADIDAAIAGASDIIAEWVNENETARSRVRDQFRRYAVITSKVVKGKEEDAANYATYFNYSAPLARCSSHNYLAMRRGEAEGMLRVSIGVDDERTLARLYPIFIRRNASEACAEIIRDAIDDAYKRLTRPAIENEAAAEAKQKAETAAIDTFTTNLRQLLLASPLGTKRVLAVDPGYRTGCKVVCLDSNGNLLCHDVIYPTPPHSDTRGAAHTIFSLVMEHDIEAIALGNGTASRETERFLRSMSIPDVEIYVVSENGASVYSASKVARDEFPDKDVTVRGAVSIGRRLMDPLAELVKIDPKSIGVGQYQHDVDQTRLKAALDMTVESCVNAVGVDINTASRQLLAYVSGIGDTLAANIVDYRAANGDFPSREAIKKVPRLGPKTFEQAAGFLRIPTGANILDHTAVHPERYPLVTRMARDLRMELDEIVKTPQKLKELDLSRYIDENTGMETLTDIIRELEKPGRDPRSEAVAMEFDDSISDITDLRPGMILPGIVNNITDFGAFVDLGIHKSGLIHVSQMAERRVKNPSEVVRLNQRVRVKVLEVDLKRDRIALSLRDVPQD